MTNLARHGPSIGRGRASEVDGLSISHRLFIALNYLLLPISALADRYGVCDDCGGGGDDIFSYAIGAIILIGIIIWLPRIQRILFFSLWLGITTASYLLGLETLGLMWFVVGWMFSIPIAFWIVERFGLDKQAGTSNEVKQVIVGDQDESRSIAPSCDLAQVASAADQNPHSYLGRQSVDWTTQSSQEPARESFLAEAGPFAKEGDGYGDPLPIEVPSPAIGPEKLFETIGVLRTTGEFTPVLSAFSWLPIAESIPVRAIGIESQGMFLRLARRKGAFPGHLTELGTFLFSGFAQTGDPRIEILVSASSSGLEIQARDAAGSAIRITRCVDQAREPGPRKLG